MTVAKTPGFQTRRRAGAASTRHGSELRARVEEVEFSRWTTKARWKIRQLGRIAAQAVGTAVAEAGAAPDESWIRYVVRDAGSRELLEFFLQVEGNDSEESWRVTLVVGDYIVSQRRLLGLIPVGPKSVDGHRSVRLFAQYLQQIL